MHDSNATGKTYSETLSVSDNGGGASQLKKMTAKDENRSPHSTGGKRRPGSLPFFWRSQHEALHVILQ